MFENRQVRTRIRIARGSKEALEQMRGSLQDGELFWQKGDSENEDELRIGTDESNDDESQ